MTGMKIGKLTVVKRAENTKQNKTQWLCQCDCGNLLIVPRRRLIDSGSTRSCKECLRKQQSMAHTTHGMKNTRLYRIWSGMKDRTCNSKSKYWNRYGGRGVYLCDEWKNDFLTFKTWSYANGYSDNLTLDRINNNDGYTPNNCRWVSYKVQENNRSNNRCLMFNGATKTISQWADDLGLDRRIISSRIYHGWSIERALTQAPKRRSDYA